MVPKVNEVIEVRKGYTFMELMVALMILSIVAGMVLVAMSMITSVANSGKYLMNFYSNLILLDLKLFRALGFVDIVNDIRLEDSSSTIVLDAIISGESTVVTVDIPSELAGASDNVYGYVNKVEFGGNTVNVYVVKPEKLGGGIRILTYKLP